MNESSNMIGKLAEALAKAQGEFPVIQKNRTAEVPTKNGGKYSYKYADLADVLTAVRPVLAKNGLSIVQHVEGEFLKTELWHSGGAMIAGRVPFVAAQGYGPQATGSSLTYSRRYGLCALLGITAEEDDDGQLAEGSGSQGNKKNSAGTNSAASTRGSGSGSKVAPKEKSEYTNEKAVKLGFDNAEKHASMVRFIWIKVKEAGLTKDDVVNWCENNAAGVQSTKDLNWVQINALKKDLEAEIRKNAAAKNVSQFEVGSDEDIAAAAREPGEEG